MKKNNKELPFVCTFQKEIADELLQNGFSLMSEENGKYVFMNNGTLKFDSDSEKDKEKLSKICYTNVLCI